MTSATRPSSFKLASGGHKNTAKRSLTPTNSRLCDALARQRHAVSNPKGDLGFLQREDFQCKGPRPSSSEKAQRFTKAAFEGRSAFIAAFWVYLIADILLETPGLGEATIASSKVDHLPNLWTQIGDVRPRCPYEMIGRIDLASIKIEGNGFPSAQFRVIEIGDEHAPSSTHYALASKIAPPRQKSIHSRLSC